MCQTSFILLVRQTLEPPVYSMWSPNGLSFGLSAVLLDVVCFVADFVLMFGASVTTSMATRFGMPLSSIVTVLACTVIKRNGPAVRECCLLYYSSAVDSAVIYNVAESDSSSRKTKLHFVNVGDGRTQRP